MKLPGNIMHSVLLKRQRLSGVEDKRSVYSIELSIPDASCHFEPGDVVYIYPKNNESLVQRLLKTMVLNEDALVIDKDTNRTLTLHEALGAYFEFIIKPSVWARFNNTRITDFWSCLQQLKALHASEFCAQSVCDWLKPMRPRAYSIASAQQMHPLTMELIVGLVTYKNVEGGICEGLSSGFLCKRLNINEFLKIYVKTSHFKLPADPQKPIIMVGPGTGIAPFKAFLEARKHTKATGENWLFFGGRTRKNDFLLQDFLIQLQKDGFLERLDLAFSRDQSHKIYVQHRMLEQAAIVWEWLQKGAYFYICGEAKSMAKDVEAALLKIIAEQGKMEDLQAEKYLQMLKSEGRYQKDVY